MADVEVRQDGAVVSAEVGDRVLIRVPENAGTGYQWAIGEVGPGLEVESDRVELPSQLRPGAAAERVFVLRARAGGRDKVELRLRRSWEPEPIEVFRAEISVTA